MSVLAIIPARGGSEGIPRKKVRRVVGKPFVAHTIEQARQARSVNRVVVSTDDAEVAAISRPFGAEVIWPPAGRHRPVRVGVAVTTGGSTTINLASSR